MIIPDPDPDPQPWKILFLTLIPTATDPRKTSALYRFVLIKVKINLSYVVTPDYTMYPNFTLF